MKRLFAVIMSLAMLALAAFSAIAAVGSVTELFEKWENEGYPDDVGGVYSAHGDMGSLVVLLVNGTDERKAEIAAMVEDPANLSFDESAYSYNELLAVQDEIEAMMTNGDKNVYGVGVGWSAAEQFGASGKEFRVVVGVLTEAAEEYKTAFAAKYGDKVVVEAGDGVMLDDAVALADEDSTDGELMDEEMTGEELTDEDGVIADEELPEDEQTTAIPNTGDGSFGAIFALIGSLAACALLIFAAKRANSK